MVILFKCLFAALSAYGVAGIIAAIPLHARGLAAIDHAVAGSGWKFRVLITPGLLALWPLLLARWWKHTGIQPEPDRWAGLGTPRMHRSAHGLLILLIAVLIPLLCGAGLLARGVSEARNSNAPQAAALRGEP